MWASFAITWFLCKVLDEIWPPPDTAFNAAIALGAMLVCYATWEKTK